MRAADWARDKRRRQNAIRRWPPARRWQSGLISGSVFVLVSLWRPAYANGGHLHIGIGGVFFLLLGGLVFIGGLALVVYFLFRTDNDDAAEDISEQDGE